MDRFRELSLSECVEVATWGQGDVWGKFTVEVRPFAGVGDAVGLYRFGTVRAGIEKGTRLLLLFA